MRDKALGILQVFPPSSSAIRRLSHSCAATTASLHFCIHHPLRGNFLFALTEQDNSPTSCVVPLQMIWDKKYCREVAVTGNIRLSVRSPAQTVQDQLKIDPLPSYCCVDVLDSEKCTIANDSLTPTRRPCWCTTTVITFLFTVELTFVWSRVAGI